MKKFKSAISRAIISVIAIILIVVLPAISFSKNGEIDFMYGVFVGQKSKYAGMIEVWNVDSFEGGTGSKRTFLENAAKAFQQENKGTFVYVRNLTEQECVNLLASGSVPNLISCSYGVAEKIKEYCCAYANINKNIYSNFLEAGTINGNVYGLPWCTGFYCLISTQAKLQRAGKGGQNLNEIAFSAGYEYKVGKTTKKSDSLIFGTSDYLMPKTALDAYNKARSIQTNTQDKYTQTKSQYSAYSLFLANSATILLGTQRDICRMENRVSQGKVSDVIFLPLLEWTDLVQFMFVCKSENKLAKSYAEKFACFLTESKMQKSLQKIGLFPICSEKELSYSGVMLDILLENFSICKVKSIFEKAV